MALTASVTLTENPAFEPQIAARASDLLDRAAAVYADGVRRAMENSPASGRAYRSGSVSVEGGRQGGGYHRASAPGEPPAPDTRTLVESIATAGQGLGFAHTVDVGVMSVDASRYVIALELGTSRMLPRPVWLPELQRAASSLGIPE